MAHGAGATRAGVVVVAPTDGGDGAVEAPPAVDTTAAAEGAGEVCAPGTRRVFSSTGMTFIWARMPQLSNIKAENGNPPFSSSRPRRFAGGPSIPAPLHDRCPVARKRCSQPGDRPADLPQSR